MNNPYFSIDQKTFVITGASSGIGRQSAIDFSNAGANLVLLGRNKDRLSETQKMCIPERRCNIYCCDLTDVSTMEQVEGLLVAENGLIDGMLYCAGIEKTLPYNKLSSVDYSHIFDVNVVGAVNLLKYLTKKGVRAEHAKYVIVASITAVVGRPGVSAYAASKGALVSLVKTISLEMAQKGLTINCISPGTILTPLMMKMMESLTPEQQEERRSGFPLGLGTPSDVSNTAMFLLSDAARWITGQNIIVDGGYTVR